MGVVNHVISKTRDVRDIVARIFITTEGGERGGWGGLGQNIGLTPLPPIEILDPPLNLGSVFHSARTRYCRGGPRIIQMGPPTPKEGAPTYYSVKISQKLHENEEILVEGDVHNFTM